MSESLDLDLDIAPQPNNTWQPIPQVLEVKTPKPDFMASLGWFVAIVLAVIIGFKFLLSFGGNVVPPRPLSDRYDVFVIDDPATEDPDARMVMGSDKFWDELKTKHGMDWRFYPPDAEEIKGTKVQEKAKEVGEPALIVQEKTGEIVYGEKMADTTDGVRKQLGKWLK